MHSIDPSPSWSPFFPLAFLQILCQTGFISHCVTVCQNTALIINAVFVFLSLPLSLSLFLSLLPMIISPKNSSMNKWLFKLKAEIRKQHFNTTIHHCRLSSFANNNRKRTQKKKKKYIIQSSHIHTVTSQHLLSLQVYHFTPFKLCLQVAALTPPTSPQHTIHPPITSVWHRWHSYGQLTCERLRLMCGSACGSVEQLSVQLVLLFVSIKRAISADCCRVFGLCWVPYGSSQHAAGCAVPHLSVQAQDDTLYRTRKLGSFFLSLTVTQHVTTGPEKTLWRR